jgi:anti-sigma regulatory factor (Ser/Thr protein kinase)
VADHVADKIRRVDLPAGSAAAAQARAVAARFCEENALWEAMDSVVLVTSELVSNAVRHAHSNPHVRFAIRGPYIYVSVQDHSTRLPVLRDVDHLNVSPLPQSGRGLHMVDVHSSAWGSIPFNGDKTVWAEIRVVPVATPLSQ